MADLAAAIREGCSAIVALSFINIPRLLILRTLRILLVLFVLIVLLVLFDISRTATEASNRRGEKGNCRTAPGDLCQMPQHYW